MQMTPLSGTEVKGTRSSEQGPGHITDVSPVVQKHHDNIHGYGLVVHPSAYTDGCYTVIYNTKVCILLFI